MGKEACLHNKVEPLLRFFELSALYLPTPDPACRAGITPLLYVVQTAWPYEDIPGSILIEDALPPPSSYLGILFIYVFRNRLEMENQNKTAYILNVLMV